MSKPDHVLRMEAELDELNERVGKLDTFVAGNQFFLSLAPTDQDLLRAQGAAMKAYGTILTARLARVTPQVAA